MAFADSPAYVFSANAIHYGAPERSGVYALFTPAEWVYIGDADNVRRALFDLLNASPESIASHEPLSFVCEDVGALERPRRRDALVAELKPVCHQVIAERHVA
jgi:hypothetical protein